MGQQQHNYKKKLLQIHSKDKNQRQDAIKKISNVTNLFNSKLQVQHQGILKLSSVPFPSCIQIQPNLYIERSQVTLHDLVETRLRTIKLFTQEDITKLLESVLYTLAYLQSKNIVYKDLHPINIYYNQESSSFKLFPPELLQTCSYEMIMNRSRFSLLSPEMIIAFRYNQKDIQNDIYHNSNVFIFGMILLQTFCLQPSSQCYDLETLDILDKNITQRLEIIEKYYGYKLLKILRMMLQYDYTKRPNLTEMAIFVNNQLHQTKKIPTQIGGNHIEKYKNNENRLNYTNRSINQNNHKINFSNQNVIIGRILELQNQNLLSQPSNINHASFQNTFDFSQITNDKQQRISQTYNYVYEGRKKQDIFNTFSKLEYNQYIKNEDPNIVLKQYNNYRQKDYTKFKILNSRKNSFYQPSPNKQYQQKKLPQPSQKNSKHITNRQVSPQPFQQVLYIPKSKQYEANNLPYTLTFNLKNINNNQAQKKSIQYKQNSLSQRLQKHQAKSSVQLQNQFLPSFPKSNHEQEVPRQNRNQSNILKPYIYPRNMNEKQLLQNSYQEPEFCKTQKHINSKIKQKNMNQQQKINNLNNSNRGCKNDMEYFDVNDYRYQQYSYINNRKKSTERKYNYTNQLQKLHIFQKQQNQSSDIRNVQYFEKRQNDKINNSQLLSTYSKFENQNNSSYIKQIQQLQESIQNQSSSRVKSEIQKSRQLMLYMNTNEAFYDREE